MSLNKRLALTAISIALPLTILIFYLLSSLDEANEAYGQITDSVTYANEYSVDFKQRMDYSMYLAVISNREIEELGNEETVNGIKTVNPYLYIMELEEACDHLAQVSTVEGNKSKIRRVKRSLDTLRERVREIDENIGRPGAYSDNLEALDGNIRSLTTIIQKGIQDYIYMETANFATVKADLRDKAAEAYRICLAAVVIVLILAAALSVLASRSVIRPIKQLCSMAKKVAGGDFTARTVIESRNEIAVLTGSFNEMTAKIGKLVEDIKTEQENLRLTETKLLQAQINPHFLYNTLDTIVWLAEEKQTEEVVRIVTALSDFFRTTLSNGRDCFTVEEEKKHIESYLRIQQFRYQDILDYDILIDGDIYSYVIPKLTLQPLVENALYHGIKNKRRRGKITVYGRKEQDRLIFQVVDNGKGMSEEKLSWLRNSLDGLNKPEDGGFGIGNVNRRIRHYYGAEYGIFFKSSEEEGTEATVVLAAKNIEPIS